MACSTGSDMRPAGTRRPPQHVTGDEEQPDQDRELDSTDPVLRAVSVIPSERRGDWKAEQQCKKGKTGNGSRPLKGFPQHLRAMQGGIAEGDVRKGPLNDLMPS